MLQKAKPQNSTPVHFLLWFEGFLFPFVIDSTDGERLNMVKEELFRLLEHQDLKDACILIFANKQDLKTSQGPAVGACFYGGGDGGLVTVLLSTLSTLQALSTRQLWPSASTCITFVTTHGICSHAVA